MDIGKILLGIWDTCLKHYRDIWILNTVLGIYNFPGIASFNFFLARFARSVYNEQHLLVACAAY